MFQPRRKRVERQRRKLYWYDLNKHYFEVINFDRTERRVVIGMIDSNPIDMVIYNNYIYYTDWLRTGIMRVTVDGRCPELLDPRGLQRLKGIFIYSNTTNNDNPKNPGSCTLRNGLVRLVDGSSMYEGRVEVHINYAWGGICDDNFRVEDAQVVCAMLGYDRYSARRSTQRAFGSGSGKYWFDKANCTGEEGRLVDCPFGTLGMSNCPSGVSAGVICTPPSKTKDFVLMATTETQQLYRMDLSTFSHTAIPISVKDRPMSVTFDPVYQTIYWTDVILRQIRSIGLTNNTETLIKQLPLGAVPNGIAVDADEGLMFYADAGLDVLGKLNLDGKSVGNVAQESGMKPRGIVLDKTNKYIYWTDWGTTPSIEKAAYNGSDRQIIVNTFMQWPNDLTIDFPDGKLYWCDAGTDFIEVVDLDGRNRIHLIRVANRHPFSISLYNDYLYYSDWTLLSLMRIHKGGGLPEELGSQSFQKMNAIYTHPASSFQVHGGWSVWSAWSSCDASCGGGGGLRLKTRTCNNPTPDRGGSPCVGHEYETATCVLPACPIDGGFSQWSLWNTCSLTCGTGSQFRTRACDNPTPSNNGTVCSGITSEVVECNKERCPVDGGWGIWTSWNACTATCGGGLQQRTRTCTSPFPINGGKQCDGTGFESQVCSQTSCPVNGNWGAWSDWNTCTVTCGGATQLRQRSCDNPLPSGNGQNCTGISQDTQQCATQSCPRDGSWTQWNLWSICSATCNSGLRSRQRECTQPAPLSGGQYCKGNSTDTEICNTQQCPTDGLWGGWGPWSTCSRTCNTGSQQRLRSCNNPSPISGGQECTGSGIEIKSCETQFCPVDGNWTFWSTWDTCTVTCGGGIYTRTRTCANPAPQNDGRYCSGVDSETGNCNTGLCIINGNWGEWGGWSACSVTCSSGSQTRSRECNNPFPLNGGSNCLGVSSDVRICIKTNCPVNGSWSLWGSWSGCTKTCGKGVTTRSRECASPSPLNGGKYCEGDYFQTNSCADIACPVHGGLGQWEAWSTCSLTCGGGVRSRQRFCNSPSPINGGQLCTGSTKETQECNLNICPINGNWNQWQYWSPCNKDCGIDSTRYRDRTCTAPSPLNGGSFCSGSSRVTEPCPEIPCPVNGVWGQWSAYSNCPTTCGEGGWRESTRKCDSPAQANGGNFCEGDSKRYLICSQPECPVDGGPGEWGPWTSCSESCGFGSRSRIRYCNNPSPKGSGAQCNSNDLFGSEICTLDVCTTTTSTTTPASKSPPVSEFFQAF